MTGQLVKLQKEVLAACMKCPLCNKLLRDATTISLCLHTFCRKCIFKRLSEEDDDSCPVCNIDLGCVPVDKLRPDHSLEDIRAKIFPYRRRKAETPQAVSPSSVSPPVRRKERSLSSLVVATPKVPVHAAAFTGRATKPASRKMNLRASSSSSTKESGPSETFLDKLRRNSTSGNPSQQDQLRNKEVAKDIPRWDRNVDVWKPLNCLVEAANRTKPSTLSHQDSPLSGKHEALNVPYYEKVRLPKAKVTEQAQKSKAQQDNTINEPSPAHGRSVNRRRSHDKRNASGGQPSSSSGTQAIIDIRGANGNGPNHPIWFSLVASQDLPEINTMPQIPVGYLRVKDSNLPVSYIQKYLMKKLDLQSETEVELTCQGHRVLPTLQLHHVLDLWLKTLSAARNISAPPGSSAKEYVMVLYYSRKNQPV